jgi:hypothetical protein
MAHRLWQYTALLIVALATPALAACNPGTISSARAAAVMACGGPLAQLSMPGDGFNAGSPLVLVTCMHWHGGRYFYTPHGCVYRMLLFLVSLYNRVDLRRLLDYTPSP